MATCTSDIKTRFFLIIGEPCPSTFLATCFLSQLDSNLVIVQGKCIDHAVRMLDPAHVVGVVFAHLRSEQWEAGGAARRFIDAGQVRHCAVIDVDPASTVAYAALRKDLVVFRSQRSLATDLEEFFLANPTPALEPESAPEAPAMVETEVLGAGMPVNLTRRQADVLNLLQRGYSSKRIAAQLGLNKGTVDNHVSGLLRVIGANNRAHALAIAAELGILGAQPELAAA
jgi:DNA-binding CsgD family transcriptional regulator